MKTIVTMFLTAGLMLAGSVRTFTGIITDSMCGAKHTMGVKPDAECVKQCVRSGGQWTYVLYDGKRIYKLSDQQTPERFAARKVKVTGTLYEKTGVIKVNHIELAKN